MTIKFPGEYYQYTVNTLNEDQELSADVPAFIKVAYIKNLIAVVGTGKSAELAIPNEKIHTYTSIPLNSYIVRLEPQYRSDPDDTYLITEYEFNRLFDIPDERPLTHEEISSLIADKLNGVI